MKSTGIIRRTDDLGRIVIPKELRKSFGIEENTPLEIFLRGNQIILEKSNQKVCQNCGQTLNEKCNYCSNCGKKQ